MFNFGALKQGDAYNPQSAEELLCPMRGSNSWYFDWGNKASCQVSNMFVLHTTETVQKSSNDGA